jgi:DNA-binding GntR family transcriptional regulator
MSLKLAPVSAENSTSLAIAVYEAVLQGIMSGRLTPGTVLSEVALAKQLQVSRTPVHDALRQLAKDGVVEQSTGRRARVARFTRDDLFEIFELRKFLEGPAAELAAGRMDQRQIGPLRTMADELAADTAAEDWLQRWVAFDEVFHSTIAESSGNRRLAQAISRYRLVHRGFNPLNNNAESLQQALREHCMILDALAARDAAGAREAMVQHIAAWQQYFVERFPYQG